MSDADRIMNSGNERERALLRAGIDEGPSDASVRAAERVLGLVPGVAARGPDRTSKPLGRLPAGGGVATTVPALPAFVAGALTLGAIAVTFYATGLPHAPVAIVAAPLSRESSVPASTQPVAPRAAAAQASPVSIGAPSVAPGEPSDGAFRGAGSRIERGPAATVGTVVSTPGPDALGAEMAMVDLARTLGASGEWGTALRVLDEHDRRYPNGTLAEEADLLRIEAVRATGRGADAAALARRFLARHPASVHAEAVRSSLAGAPH